MRTTDPLCLIGDSRTGKRFDGMTFGSSSNASITHRQAELVARNSWLDYERATLLIKLESLTDQQVGQRMLSSETHPAWTSSVSM